MVKQRNEGDILTSKQRAYLRSLAVNQDTILYVGKSGLGAQVFKEAGDA